MSIFAFSSCFLHPHVRRDSGSRDKKLSRVGKGVPDKYVAFRLGTKKALLGATNAVAQVKI